MDVHAQGDTRLRPKVMVKVAPRATVMKGSKDSMGRKVKGLNPELARIFFS